ncbi:MerR family transcriptional regulator [Paracoccus sp. PARArs4]|uniref:MerR family transcriptional regulator n=1 Tax=Paracoccus sp. PARArs4 TaxID=2853442 RepID=UPI0024A6287C|nr:MerR family transcriptional regulator [Paracoccus sp. PARArs4]
MQKGAEAFRSIGEVASLIGVAPHVLRYWETQFAQLRPMKRPDGRRYYRPADVALAAGICVLLRDDGLTIRGAKKQIGADRGEAVRKLGLGRIAEPAPAATEAPAPEPVAHDATPAWLARLGHLTRLLRDITPADARRRGVFPLLGQAHDALTRLG